MADRVLFDAAGRVTQRGTGSPGRTLPEALADLPSDRLALVEGEIVDVATLAEHWVDADGQRSAVAVEGAVQIDGPWDTPLMLDGETGAWRAATDEEIEAVAAAQAARDVRKALRREIDAVVGDLPSLIGTQADVVGMLVYGQMVRVVTLADHASNEQQRQELAMLEALAGEEVDLVALCRDALGKIERREVVLTAAVKGVAAVFAEALTRSTQTAALLMQAAGEGEEAAAEGEPIEMPPAEETAPEEPAPEAS